MANKFKKISLIASFLFLFFAFNDAHGQMKTAGSINIADSVEITTTPAFPSSNENVFVRIESYSFDLNSSEIIWALNGIIKDKGVGKKDFYFKTENVGSASLIKILIKTKEGKDIEKSLVVRPAEVDILWEADSYVPPFYKGKALYGYQGLVTVIALPNMVNSDGVKINPDTLTYKWTKDSQVLGSVSGYGKNKFSFSKSILSDPAEIKVEAMSSDKKIKAVKTIILDAVEPKAILYENNPLYGIIYEKALANNFKLSDKEISLIATPYFFSANEVKNNGIKYDWNMNGRGINNKSNAKGVTFRNVDGGSGSARISVGLLNGTRELQSARTSVLLDFTENQNDRTASF